MYSRNTWDKRDTYSLPPGYDGSRFRRRRRYDDSGRLSEDEVIIVPDSSYAALDENEQAQSHDSGELSVRGIPTNAGIRRQKKNSANAEFALPADTPPSPDLLEENEAAEADKNVNNENRGHAKEKITELLEKLGFSGGLSSDDLLLCAIIFIIASDTDHDGCNVGDILLILALLLGIK